MAIEFNCPYCTSTIRVKDNAAGKRGKCPRCSERLLVPTVQAPQPIQAADAPVPSTPQASPAPVPAVAEPAAAQQPVASEPVVQPAAAPVDSLPLTDVPIIAPVPASHAARPRRRRSNSGPLVMSILGVCFVTIVGLLGYYWWSNRPLVLEGRVAGELVGASSLRPTTIPIGNAEISETSKTAVLSALGDLPYSLKSNLLVTEFRGTDTQAEVRLLPTTTTSIVRVNLRTEQNVVTWLKDNQDMLDGKRASDLTEASAKFFADYQGHITEGLSMSDPGYFRNKLALAVVNSGLGYAVEAIAEKQVCPCVFEDTDGNLYFAVPRGTDEFTIRGRMLNGKKMFPGSYVVGCGTVTEEIRVVEPAAPAPKPDAATEKSDAMPDGSPPTDDASKAGSDRKSMPGRPEAGSKTMSDEPAGMNDGMMGSGSKMEPAPAPGSASRN